jgi:hypothetical protein
MSFEVVKNGLYVTEHGHLVRILSTVEGSKHKLFDFAVGWLIDSKTDEKRVYHCSRNGDAGALSIQDGNIIEHAVRGLEVETYAVVATGLGKYPKGFILNLTDSPDKTESSSMFKDNPGHWVVVKLTGKI